jgi:anti-sigma B factor antagonist
VQLYQDCRARKEPEEIRRSAVPKSSVLKVSKRLDASNSAEFKSEAVSILDGPAIRFLVIDFSETGFLDSAGLGALVSILKNVSQSKDKRLALASLSPHVRQIFELTKLYRLFEIYNSVDEAVSELDC